MFARWSALRPAVLPIVSAPDAECNGLVVYVFGYLKHSAAYKCEENLPRMCAQCRSNRVKIE